MLSRFFKSTLFFLLIISLKAHSTTVDLHHVTYIKHATKHDTVSSVSKNVPSIIDLLFEQITATQTTPQNYKPGHFVSHSFVSDQNISVDIYSLKYSYGGCVSRFSRFHKLILFPFHVFW
jgi:hypothetical protein